MFAPLLRYVERTNPTEFRLPDDIRTNFANGTSFETVGQSFVIDCSSHACFSLSLLVQTAINGAYADNYEQKPVKFEYV